MKRRTSNIIWSTLLSFVIIISAYLYLRDTSIYIAGNDNEFSDIRKRYKWWIIAHFGFAAATLFIGPLQFIPAIRNRFLKFHRLTGKIYILGSTLAALTVFVLLATTYTLPGAIPSLGFLAIIWLFTTLAAYYFIRKKRITLHKEFMIRSYVCGLAFVFIRILPEINGITGIFNFIEDDHMRRTVYEWVCWVYPLMITEFWLVWRKQILRVR